MALLYQFSSVSNAMTVLLALLILASSYVVLAAPEDCIVNGTLGEDDCGMDSTCQNGLCRCDLNFFTPSGTHTDCRNSDVADPMCEEYDLDCVYCGAQYDGPCRKCVNVIGEDGQCYDSCPIGTQLTIQNIASINLSVRMCTGGSVNLPVWAIAVIVALGALLLLIGTALITSIFCTCLRKSSMGQLDVAERNNSEQVNRMTEVKVQESKEEKSRDDKVDAYFQAQYNPDFAEEVQDEEEFMKSLAALRPQAEVFLKMLNDMRRRLKEIPQHTPAAQQYRNVMQDLTRLLYLLNKKPERVQVPPDGLQLLSWSEQILQRYLRSQGRPAGTAAQPTRLSVLGDQVETNF